MIVAGGVVGAIAGGIFGFGGSALSQIFSGEDFSFKKALGAGANGAIVGGVHGALIGSGVGIGVSLAADFGAGVLGSTAEQLIGTGRAGAKESIKSGLINAVTGRIYGTGELKSAKSAFLRGFAAGGATSGINYLSDALTPRAGRLGRSSLSGLTGTMLMGAASAIGRDPRRGCETGVRDNDWMGLRTAYGYQYGGTQAGQEKSEYSVGGFFKETLIGAVTGGLASTAFYGAGKVFQALTGSIWSNKGNGDAIPGASKLIGAGKGEQFGINASSATPIEGYTDVIVHGAPPNHVGVMHNGEWNYLDQRSLANFLKQDAGYTKGPIRLIACGTGSTPNGFAQNLANKMGVEVMAPSDIIWAFPDGKLTIGPKQYSNTGQWNIFLPGNH
ncbi:MAG: hypothetical protein HDR24_02840 [Lachnospiraceae bacterium]|nr:hypothetical protein [Lachnospiraceae bacterium]